MRRCYSGILAALTLAMTAPAQAAPLDQALQTQLIGLFDQYNKDLVAGKLDDAAKLRSAKSQKEMRNYLKNPKTKKEFLAFASDLVPDSLEVKHATVSKDGLKATILTIASKKVTEAMKIPDTPPGTVLHAEITLDFLKEKGRWTYDNQTIGMDPDKMKACTDEAYEPIDAYDRDQNTNMGGPIVRVDFANDHTLVVVRVLDEETCTFLPERARLEKAGLNTTLLVPYAIAEIDGFPHKTNKQKLWVDNITVHAEE